MGPGIYWSSARQARRCCSPRRHCLAPRPVSWLGCVQDTRLTPQSSSVYLHTADAGPRYATVPPSHKSAMKTGQSPLSSLGPHSPPHTPDPKVGSRDAPGSLLNAYQLSGVSAPLKPAPTHRAAQKVPVGHARAERVAAGAARQRRRPGRGYRPAFPQPGTAGCARRRRSTREAQCATSAAEASKSSDAGSAGSAGADAGADGGSDAGADGGADGGSDAGADGGSVPR